MKTIRRPLLNYRAFTFGAISYVVLTASIRAQDLPIEWVEPSTGHKVVRLSTEPGTMSFYFHQNAYSKDGRKLVVTNRRGIATIDLETKALDQVIEGRVWPLVVGRKTGQLYIVKDGAVQTVDLETHQITEIAKVPYYSGRGGGNITVNSDESLLVGIARDPEGKDEPRSLPESERGGRLGPRWAAGTPLLLYTMDFKTKKVKTIHTSHEWLNHLQCSPTDPNQILFCNEGPWHLVDRTWLIRADGADLTKVHTRRMIMEIAGHEFFSGDGKTIWYDLQTPRSEVFWLAGYNIETKERTWLHLDRKEWSVHYNISPDGQLFAGDGGGPSSVANSSANGKRLNPPGNGQWIYLFRPEKSRVSGLPGQEALIHAGAFKAERLVDLAKHDYSVEPNVTFTPDGKWIVFRATIHGAAHVYKVQVARQASAN